MDLGCCVTAYRGRRVGSYLKWREGSLSPALWSGWAFNIMDLVHAPGGRDFWDERGYMFADAFRGHVENDMVARSPLAMSPATA